MSAEHRRKISDALSGPTSPLWKGGPKAERRRLTLKQYGLDIDRYDEILEAQDGGCALCGREPAPDRRLAVDHDHETGIVRGLLCAPCNRALGMFRDDPELIRAAATYLEWYAATA